MQYIPSQFVRSCDILAFIIYTNFYILSFYVQYQHCYFRLYFYVQLVLFIEHPIMAPDAFPFHQVDFINCKACQFNLKPIIPGDSLLCPSKHSKVKREGGFPNDKYQNPTPTLSRRKLKTP